MGMGSRRTLTAALPPGQFYCLLDELPLHLIPRRHFAGHVPKNFPKEKLFLNPQCRVLPAGKVPKELASKPHLLNGFNLQRTIAWVRDLKTGALNPFWLGPRLEALVSTLGAGESVPDSIPADFSSLLVDAGILIPEGYRDDRSAEWTGRVKKAAQLFAEKGFAPLSDLVHPFLIAALRRYYRHAIRRGNIRLGDEHVPRRYVAHNDPVARFFHEQIADTVSRVVGEAIKPSYVYMACYLEGAELKKHTDRPQCEFSVTLCLDFSPEPEAATSWPIGLDTAEGKVTIYQALGDGLVYRGTRLPHYRSRLAQGYTSTSIFFHYVPADFEGSLE